MVFLLNSLWPTWAFPSTANQESWKINGGRGQALLANAEGRAGVGSTHSTELQSGLSYLSLSVGAFAACFPLLSLCRMGSSKKL